MMRSFTLRICAALWSMNLFVISVTSVAVPAGFTPAPLLHRAKPVTGITMQLQGTAPVASQSRDGRQHPCSKDPRVLKTVSLFDRTTQDAQYLSGALAFVARHTAGRAAGTAVMDGIIPFGLLMTAIWTPRIAALVSSPVPVEVEEDIEMVTKNEATGKYELNRLNSNKAGAERMAYLMLEDLNNIREGVYPIPSELSIEKQIGPGAAEDFAKSAAFAMQSYGKTSPAGDEGRSSQLEQLAAGLGLPDHYLHDFHSIPGGFLNAEHARVYDILSEHVFVGGHRMSRRMALRPLHDAMARMGPSHAGGRGLRMLDLGTGPGSFLIQAQEAFPHLELAGLDLSPAMLAVARSEVPAHPSVRDAPAPAPQWLQGDMAAIPAASGGYDFLSCTNCFHEMPEHAIRSAAREAFRVLRPGGLFVLVDAVQAADDPAVAASARVLFDSKFSEPYMQAWLEEVDVEDAFLSAGFEARAPPKPFYVSALRVFHRPG